MLPNYSPDSRQPPSLLTGFHGTDFPAFIGTMQLLRLPSPFSSPSVSLGSDTACDTVLFLSPYKVSVSTLQDRTFRVRSVLIYRLSCGEVRLSRVPVHPLSVSDVLLDPGRTSTTRLCAVLVLPQPI